MKNQFLNSLLFGLCISGICLTSSCKKEVIGSKGLAVDLPGNSIAGMPDTSGTLVSAANASGAFPNMGFAVLYGTMSTNPAYVALVKKEANWVTFGNELKYGSVVQNDGTFDYSIADKLYNICNQNGLKVFGHNLCWYSQQNASYLNGLIRALNVQKGTPVNYVPHGDFEAGSDNNFTGWYNIVAGGAVGSFTAVMNDVDSSRAMQANVVTPGPQAYNMQSIGTNFAVTQGKEYKVTVSIKSSAAGAVRLVMQNQQYQQYDINTKAGWATYTWYITMGEPSPSLRFNFPATGTYVIDNVKVIDPNSGTVIKPTPAQVAVVIDGALKNYVTTTVQHYKGKITAWDVVNEPMSDGTGALRDSTNYKIQPYNASSQFLWANYLGRDFALKAFQYAKAADPAALLFINEYNLEYNYKLDSLIAYVKELNAKGARIDGIGTQMHLTLGISWDMIDNEMIKLAATGLQVRISELDIALNPGHGPNPPTPDAIASQVVLYRRLVQSYLKNVPKAQRFGITVWGVNDSESWLSSPSAPDYPLLYNTTVTSHSTLSRKGSYYGFLAGIKGI